MFVWFFLFVFFFFFFFVFIFFLLLLLLLFFGGFFVVFFFCEDSVSIVVGVALTLTRRFLNGKSSKVAVSLGYAVELLRFL